MSKNGNMRHHRKLLKSSPDDITLCQAVQEKFLDLCGSWLRVKQQEIDIPQDTHSDMYKWRQMAARYQIGDFRHTGAEMQALKSVAQWTVDMNCDLRNQPRKTVEWRNEL